MGNMVPTFLQGGNPHPPPSTIHQYHNSGQGNYDGGNNVMSVPTGGSGSGSGNLVQQQEQTQPQETSVSIIPDTDTEPQKPNSTVEIKDEDVNAAKEDIVKEEENKEEEENKSSGGNRDKPSIIAAWYGRMERKPEAFKGGNSLSEIINETKTKTKKTPKTKPKKTPKTKNNKKAKTTKPKPKKVKKSKTVKRNTN